MTNYVVYDVFTDTSFSGNQLAVIPDATDLDEAKLQKIAREFNFSETTFIYPAENPNNTAKVRIFTPTMEVPFAGHPTIGTAIALRDLGHQGDMVLELGVGPIPCKFDGASVAFTTSAPLERLAEPDADLVARALGLSVKDVNSKTHIPMQVSLGLPFVVVELNNRQNLANCLPATDVMREGAARFPAGLDFAIFAYVRDGNMINARMFAPLDNIPEDPATGSACATIAALLHETMNKPQSLKIRQGEYMGRPSLILATTDGAPVRVTIAGSAVKTMEGSLFV